MTTYSVFNYQTKLYDYYQGPGPKGAHAEAPPSSSSSVGACPEQASWRVPTGARKVGTGEMPKGRIATIGGAALGGVADDIPRLGLYALGAYLAWRFLR